MVETLFFDTEFYYRFKACGPEYELNIPIKIPFIGTVEEMVFRIITMFKIPAYAAQEMRQKLSDFININTKLHFDNLNEKLLSDSRKNINDITSSWETFFKEGSTIYSDHNVETDEEVFAFAYHRLVHSSALETMLQLEHRYALGIRECIEKQNKEIDSLTCRQTSEMAEAVEGLDVTTSEQKINQLAIRHFEDHSLLQAKWFSELNTIKEVQKREYRDWVMEMLEQQTKVSLRQAPQTASLPLLDAEKSFLSENIQEEPILEESFTIHLGSQLKQMHNIRLLSADVNTFLKINVDISSSHQASQRLQTAMALYSNDLCAVVFLTDNIMGFSNVTKDFVNICQQSTEFHFPHIDDQLESIADCAKNTQLYRKMHLKYDKPHSDWQTSLKKNLSTGDVFITWHSNLAKVHLVYHIIVDDTLRSADINSRHPVILGLRNILKMACSNNITTLTIPLLLQHDMTEEMTVSWCTKRAELVFKCVKGFMIEMASWGGSELKNLQFLVPKGISQSVFSTLATMLPSIFKLSNPVVFKAIQSKNS